MATIASTVTTLSTSGRSARRTFTFVVLGAVVLLLVASGVWLLALGTESTDDAQIEGHVHPLNARVSGTLTWVNPAVDDTRYVPAGTVLARLDPSDYSPAVDRLRGDVEAQQAQLQAAKLAVPVIQASAQSKLASAGAAVTEAEAELATAKAGEQSARALVAQAEATHRRAEADRHRYEDLVNNHEISRSEYDTRMTEAKTSEAQLVAAQANLAAAQQKIQAAEQHLVGRQNDLRAAETAPELIATAKVSVNRVAGELKKSQAALHDAELNLGYTEIVAPVGGVIGRKQIEAGQRVTAGQLLLNIVPTNGVWVIANFKETQLRHMHVGQPVKVHVDTDGRDLDGTVESLGGATGSRYALIAPENATGNYVKVVQRIPVRIRINAPADPQHPLLPGMSVEASVRVRG